VPQAGMQVRLPLPSLSEAEARRGSRRVVGAGRVAVAAGSGASVFACAW